MEKPDRPASLIRKELTRELSALATQVGRALRRAAQAARKTARAHGTPVYVWQDGKVVAQKP